MSPANSKWSCRFALIALCCGVPAMHAAEPPDEQLDEVVVTGTQAKLRELRMAAEKAEDAFYARYNEINGNHDFDVHCHIGKEGALRTHTCIGAHVEKARHDDAVRAITAWKGCDGSAPIMEVLLDGACGYVATADMVADGRRKDFALNLLQTMQSDVQLQQLAREREKVGAQFVQARAKLFGKDGKPRVVPTASP